MDNRTEVREFPISRRAKLTPDQAGIASVGNRRVARLRRGEVATPAGVSVEYYTRLERGNLTGVSTAVLDAVARALQLNETERAHLEDLARAANTSASAARSRRPAQLTVRLSVHTCSRPPGYVRHGRGRRPVEPRPGSQLVVRARVQTRYTVARDTLNSSTRSAIV